MSVKDYVAALQALISSTHFVTATSFSYDERPPSAAYASGRIRFVDHSQLEFKEFIIAAPNIKVVKYGYHYRSPNDLVFRYDNANDPAAKHLPSFPHHKHLPSGILAAEQPSLQEVLEEIVSKIKVR